MCRKSYRQGTFIACRQIFIKQSRIAWHSLMHAARWVQRYECRFVLDRQMAASIDGGPPLGGSKRRPYFSPPVSKFTRNFVRLYETHCNLQRRLPFNDVLLRSGNIRDQVGKLSEIASKIYCSRKWGQFYQFRSPTHHRTCGKVWCRSAERPQTRRLGAEKINIISMDWSHAQ